MISEGYAGVPEEKPVTVEQRGVEPKNSSNILIAYMSRIKLNVVAGRQRKTLDLVGIRPVGRFFAGGYDPMRSVPKCAPEAQASSWMWGHASPGRRQKKGSQK